MENWAEVPVSNSDSMYKNVIKATLTSDSGEKPKQSWTVSPKEIIALERETRSAKPSIVYYHSEALPFNRGLTPSPVVHQPKFSTPQIVIHPPSSLKFSGVSFQGEDNLSPVQKENGDFTKPISPSSFHLETDAELENEVFFRQNVFDDLNVEPILDAVDEAEIVFDQDEGVIEEEDTEMAEERFVAPVQFGGSASEDPEDWYRHFRNYCQYKGFDNDKTLGLFKVLMRGNAALWLETQSQATLADMTALKTAFDARYKTPETVMYKSAKEIFSRRQGDTESVDDFVASMQKLGRTIGAEDRMTRYAILNGLRPALQPFVTQRQPDSMDELLQAARMAELTCPIVKETDTALATQLSTVQEQLTAMSTKWDKMFSVPLEGRDDRLHDKPRSPSPLRRVTFADEREERNSGQNLTSWQPRQFARSNPNFQRRGRSFPPSFSGGRGFPPRYQRPGTSRCSRCGRAAHTNINYCPAVNQNCNYCGQRGHFAATCRTAERARAQQPSRQF